MHMVKKTKNNIHYCLFIYLFLQVIDLKTQLSNFKNVGKQLRHKLGGEEATALFSRAVYLCSIGGNDYLDPILRNSSFFESQNVRHEYVGMVIGNLTNAIQVMT